MKYDDKKKLFFLTKSTIIVFKIYNLLTCLHVDLIAGKLMWGVRDYNACFFPLYSGSTMLTQLPTIHNTAENLLRKVTLNQRLFVRVDILFTCGKHLHYTSFH